VPGIAVSVLALGAGVGVEAELSGKLVELSVGALVTGAVEDALEAERLFGADFATFAAFLGAELVSSTVAVSGAREGAALGNGVGAGVLASATTVEDVVVVLASFAGDAAFISRPEAGAACAIGAVLPTSWLNSNAPAITSAMITPKAMGKCFTEASCGIGQSRSDRRDPRGLRTPGRIGKRLHAHGPDSDTPRRTWGGARPTLSKGFARVLSIPAPHPSAPLARARFAPGIPRWGCAAVARLPACPPRWS